MRPIILDGMVFLLFCVLHVAYVIPNAITQGKLVLQELADKKAELQRREAGVKSAAHPNKETRTVEELLSFIEEERQGQAKKQGKKKKSRKKKEPTSEELPLETVRSTDSKQSGQGKVAFDPCMFDSSSRLRLVMHPQLVSYPVIFLEPPPSPILPQCYLETHF